MANVVRYIGDHPVPADTRVAGYGRVVDSLSLRVPLRRLTVVSNKRVKGGPESVEGTTVRDVREWPGGSLADHLLFAVRREELDLLILRKAFEAADPDQLAERIRENAFSVPGRQLWFLYEWLTGKQLDVPDVASGAYHDVLDPDLYHCLANGKPSRRHRLRNNLPGTPVFCPIARKTNGTSGDDLSLKVRAIVKGADPGLMKRAEAFLATGDSRSSFAIEGEKPDADRLQRWARTLKRAGRETLSTALLDRLQDEILGDDSGIHKGYRIDNVFIGAHSRMGDPMPEFVGAKSADLPDLMKGLFDFEALVLEDGGFDAVVHATALSFGFVYVHPYQDGNGRLHRYLMQHVLSERGVSPAGIVIPLSQQLLERKAEYFATLASHSAPLMESIEWRATPNGNVEVLNDTADLYRYPDVTEQVSFLTSCLNRTVEHDMPNEISYLAAYDRAFDGIDRIVDLPRNEVGLLITLIRQNGGKLSKNRRKANFAGLSEEQVSAAEAIVGDSFVDANQADAPAPGGR